MSDDGNDSRNNEIKPWSENDAAYVMGALSVEDARAFEAHMLGCEDCTQSVADLSGMTKLLDRVPLARALEPAEGLEPPPDLMLPRLIRAARTQRRRRAVWLAASGAVAASVTALAIVLGVSAGQSGPTRPAGVSVAMSTVKPGAAVTATLKLTPAAWGTKVSADCQWIGATTWSATDPQKVYRLVVVPRGGGAPQNVAQWAVHPGEEAKVVGSTDLSPDRIKSIELQAVADGSVLLRAQPNA
jgi:Putative zinc-finger